MTELAPHFSILGLDASASTAQLKAAYRREMSQWHPDRFHRDPVNLPAATERTKKINAAYENLSEHHKLGLLPAAARNNRRRTTPPHHPRKPDRSQPSASRKPSPAGFPDPSVFEEFVVSSHIVSIGYNRTTQILYIKFHGGAVYSYLDVPESLHTEFMSAESPGKFAHRFIRSRYQSIRH